MKISRSNKWMLMGVAVCFALSGPNARAGEKCGFSALLLTQTGLLGAQLMTYPIWPVIKYKSTREMPKNSHKRWALFKSTWAQETFGIRGLVAASLYFPFLFFGQATDITEAEMIQATPDFDVVGEDDVVVIVDGFVGTFPDFHSRSVTERYESFAQKTKHTYLIRTKNLDEIRRVIWKIKQLHPITRLEFHSHGTPGVVLLGSRLAPRKIPIDELLPFTSESSSVFAKGAKIRFHSCGVGQGEEGKVAMESLARSQLHEGGEVIAPLVAFEDSETRTAELGRAFPILHFGQLAIHGELMNTPLYGVTPAQLIRRVSVP